VLHNYVVYEMLIKIGLKSNNNRLTIKAIYFQYIGFFRRYRHMSIGLLKVYIFNMLDSLDSIVTQRSCI
jgi:hypothetical protein